MVDKYSFDYVINSVGRPLTRHLEFERSSEGIQILADDADLEKHCVLKKHKFAAFNEAIGEPATKDVIEAVESSLAKGNAEMVEAAIQEHAKTVFTWMDFDFIDRISDSFNR